MQNGIEAKEPLELSRLIAGIKSIFRGYTDSKKTGWINEIQAFKLYLEGNPQPDSIYATKPKIESKQQLGVALFEFCSSLQATGVKVVNGLLSYTGLQRRIEGNSALRRELDDFYKRNWPETLLPPIAENPEEKSSISVPPNANPVLQPDAQESPLEAVDAQEDTQDALEDERSAHIKALERRVRELEAQLEEPRTPPPSPVGFQPRFTPLFLGAVMPFHMPPRRLLASPAQETDSLDTTASQPGDLDNIIPIDDLSNNLQALDLAGVEEHSSSSESTLSMD